VVCKVLFCVSPILILIKLIGEVFERIRLPSIFGEIILGVILGPGLGLIILSTPDGILTHSAAVIKLLGEIGIIFLLFSIGFEKIELERLAGSIKRSLPIAVFGTIFPFLGGFLAAIVFSSTIFHQSIINGALLIGLTMSITSIGVSLRALIDMRYLATAAGSTILISANGSNACGRSKFCVHYRHALYPCLSYRKNGIECYCWCFFIWYLYIHDPKIQNRNNEL